MPNRKMSRGHRPKLGELIAEHESWRKRQTRKGNWIMPTGTVKWFNPTKGYGFIAPDGGGKDVFVHMSDIERAGLDAPLEGDKLAFEAESGPRGLKAVSLRAA